MSATPIPPADLVAALSSLRAAFAEVHVMHECDGQCPPDCDLTDLSGSAYRDHDERNADVREVIHDRAEVLVTALEQWLAPGADSVVPLGADVEDVEDVRSGRLDGPLYRVVGVAGVLRDVRRRSAVTGDLEGMERRFVASELRPARRSTLWRHAAQVVRAAGAQWQRAVDADDEDVDSLAALTDGAEDLAELVLAPGVEPDGVVVVCGVVSDLDGAHVVQVDTPEGAGRVRVVINEGDIYDGDPDTDEPPGAHYRRPRPDPDPQH